MCHVGRYQAEELQAQDHYLRAIWLWGSRWPRPENTLPRARRWSRQASPRPGKRLGRSRMRDAGAFGARAKLDRLNKRQHSYDKHRNHDAEISARNSAQSCSSSNTTTYTAGTNPM